MESRYLYKAKRKDNDEWVYGYLWVGACSAYITPSNVGITYYEENKRIVACAYEIDPTTICRCTGLTDKNGKLIWEHDIVQVDMYSWIEPEDEAFGIITYSETYGAYGVLSKNKWSSLVDLQGSYTTQRFVLGNRFDNPELLEGQV